MLQYRQRSTKNTTAGSSLQPPRTVASSRQATIPTLAAKFCMSGMLIADEYNPQTQTIEQELQTYITGQPSPSGTNMMKFWEARLFRTTSMSGSQANTPLTSQLNETTFPTLFEIAM